MDDPHMVGRVDGYTGDRTENPPIRQRLRPFRIDFESRYLYGHLRTEDEERAREQRSSSCDRAEEPSRD